MSIASKLQDILNCKDAIKDAITAKGGTITDATPLDEYAQAVQSIPSGASLKDMAEQTLTSIDIPDGTTKVGSYAFYFMMSNTYIHIPSSVRTIESNAFYKGRDVVPEVVLDIDEGLESIESAAFRMNNIKRIVLPNSFKTLAAQAFVFCYKLQYIEIGTGITSIGVNNFNYTREENMVIICKAVNPPTLGGTVFPANYTTGKIYVPDASVNDYKTASNWSAYASYIYPLSDYTP